MKYMYFKTVRGGEYVFGGVVDIDIVCVVYEIVSVSSIM
jgi:hypothetical protein